MFEEPEVSDPSMLKVLYLSLTNIAHYYYKKFYWILQLKWLEPNEEELVKFLVEEKGFR